MHGPALVASGTRVRPPPGGLVPNEETLLRYADIVLMKGAKPQNEPRAYSADDILKTVGPTLIH